MTRLVFTKKEPVIAGWILLEGEEPILTVYEKHAAEAIAHEIGHKKMGHLVSRYELDELQVFYRELMAWDYALRDVPPGEFSRDFVRGSLKSYLRDVESSEEFSREEIEWARKDLEDLLRRYKRKFKGRR